MQDKELDFPLSKHRVVSKPSFFRVNDFCKRTWLNIYAYA